MTPWVWLQRNRKRYYTIYKPSLKDPKDNVLLSKKYDDLLKNYSSWCQKEKIECKPVRIREKSVCKRVQINVLETTSTYDDDDDIKEDPIQFESQKMRDIIREDGNNLYIGLWSQSRLSKVFPTLGKAFCMKIGDEERRFKAETSTYYLFVKRMSKTTCEFLKGVTCDHLIIHEGVRESESDEFFMYDLKIINAPVWPKNSIGSDSRSALRLVHLAREQDYTIMVDSTGNRSLAVQVADALISHIMDSSMKPLSFRNACRLVGGP